VSRLRVQSFSKSLDGYGTEALFFPAGYAEPLAHEPDTRIKLINHA
jgi:hypothetical protein